MANATWHRSADRSQFRRPSSSSDLGITDRSDQNAPTDSRSIAPFIQLFKLFAPEYEITSEIFFPNHRIVGKFLTRTLKQYLALKKEIGSVGD